MWASYVLGLILISLAAAGHPKTEKLTHAILDGMNLKPTVKVEVIEARNGCQKSLNIKPKIINGFEKAGNTERPLIVGTFGSCLLRKLKIVNDKGAFDDNRIKELAQGNLQTIAMGCKKPLSSGNDAMVLDMYDCLIKTFRV